MTQKICFAGSQAGFGGRWTVPCGQLGRNVVGTEHGVVIRLCDKHFAEVQAAGLIDRPYISRDEFERKVESGNN